MATTYATRSGTAVVVACPDCGDSVIRTSRPGLVVDAEITPGGMYAPGTWERRPILHLSHEYRLDDFTHGGGHERHVCAPAGHWTDR